MDHTSAQAWVDRHRAAWESFTPEVVADLFAPDVRYRYHPHDRPVVGRDERAGGAPQWSRVGGGRV